MTKRKKINVLFLCTGNSARSQMAEAYLRSYAGDHFEPHSAGLAPDHIHPLTIQVMKEEGISLEEQTSKHLNQYLGQKHFGYMITVCDHAHHNCPSVFPGMGKRLHWDIEDPVAFQGPKEDRLEKFREVREDVKHRILAWIDELGFDLDDRQ